MINSLRLTDAAIRFGGTLLNPDCEFDGVSINSRNIAEGDLFVALIGERLDGHEFLAAAHAAGADLTLAQLSILLTLLDCGPIRMTDMAGAYRLEEQDLPLAKTYHKTSITLIVLNS